jgi:hypothetical protein
MSLFFHPVLVVLGQFTKFLMEHLFGHHSGDPWFGAE